MAFGRRIARDERGVGALEFALVAPALIGCIVGIGQLGILFSAKADVSNAVAAGARVASTYPQPDDATIRATILARAKDLQQSRLTTPSIARNTDASGLDYADISVSYSVPLDFIVYKTNPVTLTETRRVYLAEDEITPTTGTGTSASSAGGTSTSTSTSTSSTSTSSTSTSSTSSGGHAHGNCNKKC